MTRETTHELMGGKLNVYRRENSRFWQCSTYLNGRNHRTSTKEESLAHAKQIAEDWYLELRGKARAGILPTPEGVTFREAAAKFQDEYETITEGQRSPKWVEGHRARIRLHLNPFFGDTGVSKITAGKTQEYRVYRMTGRLPGQEKVDVPSDAPAHKPPSRSTLHDEIVTLRLVLKTAIRHEWLTALPDLSPPYKTQGKIVHRPWFSPAEYKQLYEAARAYAKDSVGKPWAWNAAQVYDYILLMANTGLRPDEAKQLQHRDVNIVDDEATGERILHIEVRGKVGFGNCKSMPGAVRVYERLLNRAKPMVGRKKDLAATKNEMPQPTDLIFPGYHLKLFNGILERAQLKLDREGNRRTAYSLRHTYICMRLMEGANVWQIARNCRTSVEMIEKFYATHIMNVLDASAINVVRQKMRKPNDRPSRGRTAKSLPQKIPANDYEQVKDFL